MASARIYKDKDYKGDYDYVTTGEFSNMDDSIGNDKLSSLKVYQNTRVELYEDKGFQGKVKVFYEGDYPDMGVFSFNDKTSSFKS